MNTLNNQNNTTSNLVSFAGTALAASYLPVFISPVVQKGPGAITLSNGLSIIANYYCSETLDINAPIISKSFLQLVFQYVKSQISSFTKEQKLNEIREEFNCFIEKSKCSVSTTIYLVVALCYDDIILFLKVCCEQTIDCFGSLKKVLNV